MTLDEFIAQFDKENTIVLLEGKRNVKEEDQEKLTALGKLLASKTKKMIFRSGNASGSDQFFPEGAAAVDHKRLEIIDCYTGYRQKTAKAYDTISLEDVNIAAEPEGIYHSKGNKKPERLIDKCVAGNRDRFTIKAAYSI